MTFDGSVSVTITRPGIWRHMIGYLGLLGILQGPTSLTSYAIPRHFAVATQAWHFPESPGGFICIQKAVEITKGPSVLFQEH